MSASSVSPSFSPTTKADPTYAPTLAPTALILNFSSLVLNIGPGTFVIIVLAATVAIVWAISSGCSDRLKLCSRFIFTAIFGVIFITLVFVPRENQYQTPSSSMPLAMEYDHSIIPRIAISCLTILFSIIAFIFMCGVLQQHKQLSTVQYEELAFWQDD